MSANRRGLPKIRSMRHDSHYVEELASARPEGSVGQILAIDSIEPNPDQPREHMGNLDDLVASIQEKGVLEPLLVREQDEGHYQILAGERRYRASVEAGLKELPCVVLKVDDNEAYEISLIENLQRRDLTPFEEAQGLLTLANKYDYTHEEIARKIGKSRTSITETLALNDVPEEVRELCRRADITSKSLLLQIAKQPSPEAMARLVRRIHQTGVSRDELRKEQRKVKPGRPRNYTFRFQPKTRSFALSLKFRKTDVPKDEIIAVLREILHSLEEEDDSSKLV